jgi:predicted secreted protein
VGETEGAAAGELSTSTVRAQAGEVEVDLEERPSTGYRWILSDCPDAVLALGESFLAGSPALRPGGAGNRRFRFRVSHPGVYEVRFELKRGWEAAPTRRHVVRLLIE